MPVKQPRQAMSSWLELVIGMGFPPVAKRAKRAKTRLGTENQGGLWRYNHVWSRVSFLFFVYSPAAAAGSLVTAQQAAAASRGSDVFTASRGGLVCWLPASAKPVGRPCRSAAFLRRALAGPSH